LTEKHLKLSESFKLREQIAKDALQSCLWLDTGTSTWQDSTTIPQWIQEQINNFPSLNISECLNIALSRL
jgi:two-component system, chemotaxis family, response regulator PixG